jgi:hypothetical protein
MHARRCLAAQFSAFRKSYAFAGRHAASGKGNFRRFRPPPAIATGFAVTPITTFVDRIAHSDNARNVIRTPQHSSPQNIWRSSPPPGASAMIPEVKAAGEGSRRDSSGLVPMCAENVRYGSQCAVCKTAQKGQKRTTRAPGPPSSKLRLEIIPEVSICQGQIR